ncbi:MAG: hypothetical protein KBF62_03290 [Candidatus Pacebacteria bacterium]|nr:hypothetical protein [Candidatus Paceibacterota bacterium]MBP9058635.1 hypothetical protein [Candidatus Paceibacterota bacterium]MBP9770340.1 hypothetical protein [Candidatus Paceibacterota bacterium]
MKNLLIVLFLSFLFFGCGEDYVIPEGKIERISPAGSGWTDIYTNSEWTTFYKMKEVSFLTDEGVLESKMVVIDSFVSEIPLTKLEAGELSVSGDAKVVGIYYSTKEWFPSWKKNLSFEKKTIRRDGARVIFEKEEGSIDMTFKQFLNEKSGLFMSMAVFMFASLIIFGCISINYLKTKKGRKFLLIAALITWIVFSFALSFWAEAFNFEIVIATFILVFWGIFFVSILIFFKNFFEKRSKQIERNRRKRQNKLKQFDTKPS